MNKQKPPRKRGTSTASAGGGIMENIYKEKNLTEAAFSLSRDEAEDFKTFPEVTHGRYFIFLKREKGCVSLFVKKTEEKIHMSPLCYYEKDTYGSTADGRVVVLRILDYNIGDVLLGIFISSEEMTPEEARGAISNGEEPLFYKAVVA